MGLDGIGSSSYGPEAALAVLIPLGVLHHLHHGADCGAAAHYVVKRHWYQHLLHAHHAWRLRRKLLLHGGSRLTIMNVPWMQIEHSPCV